MDDLAERLSPREWAEWNEYFDWKSRTEDAARKKSEADAKAKNPHARRR